MCRDASALPSHTCMHSVTFRSEALLPPLVVTPVEAQRFNSGYPHTSLLPPKLQITEPDLLEHTIYLNRDIKLAGRSFPWPRRGWGKGREKEKGQRRQKSSELRSLFRKAGSPERQAGLGSKALCAARTGASLGASAELGPPRRCSPGLLLPPQSQVPVFGFTPRHY